MMSTQPTKSPVNQGKKTTSKNFRKRPKRQQRKQRAKKQVNAPSYVTEIPTQQANYISNVRIEPQWNSKAILELQAAMTSFFLARSIAGLSDAPAQLAKLFDGIQFQWEGFSQQVAGKPALDTRLQIVHDLIRAYQQKDIPKYKFTKVSYGWTGVQDITTSVYPTGWNTWQFVIPDPDQSTYDSPATPYIATPSESAYSSFLALVKSISANRAHFLRTVSSTDPSILDNDASAYAKVYPYVGLNPSVSGGWYNDIENEVNITAPVLAHNVVYPISQQDDRVPMKLTVNEGGPATALAPLLPQFNSWFNKCHINYKFLDFFEVVNTLIYWYLAAVEQAKVVQDLPTANYQLPFSYQDFTIMIRQMLLSFFKDQWIGQFVGPLSYEAGATNFLPFQILGNCYGNDSFRRVLGPIILAENLSMLQTQEVRQTSRKSKINNVVYVPVWGYYNDVQPIWMIPDSVTPVPLFQDLGQKSINLVDCTTNGVNYINVNGAYYNLVQEQWNAMVTKLKAFLNVCDLSNLSPPSNVIFMQMTRVYGYIQRDQQKNAIIKKLPYPSLKPIANLPLPISLKETDKRKATAPQLPAPTDVSLINEQQLLSQFPVVKEFHEILNYMILPSVRFDPSSSNDLLNQQMYQTITGEGLSQPQVANNAPSYLNRQDDSGKMCVEGQGKIYSSNVAIVMAKLIQEGKGGFLSSLLGGIAKTIVPSASGVIDTIATSLPF